VDNLRGGLAGIGVKRGDAVGIISNNSTDWAVGHYATVGLGAFYVPMYEAELVHVWEYIIRDSGTKVLFVSKPEILDKIRDFPSRIPSLEKIYLIPGQGEGTMSELERIGEKNPVTSIYPDPEDVAVLVYTSGTTGEPKGALLMHMNWTSNHHARATAYPEFNENDRSLSLLPWAHCFGLGELHTFTALGASMGFMESTNTVVQDMAAIRPTFLIAVPRIFNKVYDTIVTKVNDAGGFKKKLFDMGVEAAKQRRLLAEQGRSSFLVDLKFKLVDKIVFQKIRDLFGGGSAVHDRQRRHEPRHLQVLLRYRHPALRRLRQDRDHTRPHHDPPGEVQDRERGPGHGQGQGGHRPVRGGARGERRGDHLLRPQRHEGLPPQARGNQ
jgi:long-chain acyl-CoA synthetase